MPRTDSPPGRPTPQLHDPDFSARSEEVQDLIAAIPSWIVRWGITILFLVVLGLIAGTWFIRYPDLVQAPLRLTAVHAPVSVDSRVDGKLVRLLVGEGQVVTQSQVLAYLESTASHVEVLRLAATLESLYQAIGRPNSTALSPFPPQSSRQLGELQPSFQAFSQAYQQYITYQQQGYYSRKRRMIEREISDLRRSALNLREQVILYQHDVALAETEFAGQRALFDTKVISAADLRREESRVVARKLPLKQAQAAELQNAAQQSAKQREILELDNATSEQRGLLLQALNTLRSAVDSWLNRYVLRAPVSGKVYFPSLLEENQSVKQNDPVFFLGPRTADYFGEAFIPQQNLGKVQVGQRVVVKFAGYPFQEFGSVIGHVAYISQLPGKDNAFLAKVAFDQGLTTTYGHSITYRTGMVASAEIVTADRRLLEKLFYKFRQATKLE
jgi:multidrug resistance efflux pump